MIYLLTFAVSVLLLLVWSKTRDKNKFYSRACLIIALLLPCILSAVRKTSVGIDTLVYQKPFFDIAKQHASFFSYLKTQNTSSEILYHLATWVTARYFNLSMLFFVLQLLTILPVFLALNKNKNSMITVMGIAAYYLFAYNESLNMARQSIAISFIILACSYMSLGRAKAAIFSTIIASLFHNSAIVGLLAISYIALSRSNIFSKTKRILGLATIYIGILVTLFMQPLLSLISATLNIDTLDKYIGYADRFASVSFNYPVFCIWLSLILLSTLFIKHSRSKNRIEPYLVFGFLFILSFFANTIIHYSNRIFFYFGYPFIILLLPELIVEQRSEKTKRFLAVVNLAILLFYWLLTNVFWNYNHTTPYIFGGWQ